MDVEICSQAEEVVNKIEEGISAVSGSAPFSLFFSAPLRERLERYFGHSITTARKLCLQSRRHLRHSSL